MGEVIDLWKRGVGLPAGMRFPLGSHQGLYDSKSIAAFEEEIWRRKPEVMEILRRAGVKPRVIAARRKYTLKQKEARRLSKG